jgi:endonuclease III
MRTSSPLVRGAADRLASIDALLDAAYGAPEAELGNKPDPLDEAIYIILSFQTDLARFKSTWSSLRSTYPSWDAVERASIREIARVLRDGGLHRQKARTIHRLLAEVRETAGVLSLDLLRAMNHE